MSIAQIEVRAEELKGTGGGEALNVVLQAIRLLEEQRGRLDYQNNLIATFALMQAITPTQYHAEILLEMARRVQGVQIIEGDK